jgi:hypothetical protein
MDPATALAAAPKVIQGAKIGWRVWKYLERFRYPKPKRGAEGIVIAFDCEDENVYKQVKNDLIYNLERLIEARNPTTPLQVVELPHHHIKKITSIEKAGAALHHCNGKIIFWGQAKKRSIEGEETTILELNASVRHGLVTANVSEVFAQEMREILPDRLLAKKKNDLIEMEVNAVGLNLAAHYIVAVAAFFNDIPFSLELFLALSENLAAYDTSNMPDGLRLHIETLRRRMPVNLVYCYLHLAQVEHRKWRKERDNLDYLKASYDYSMKATAIIPGLYGAALSASLYELFINNNPQKARKSMEPWAFMNDATWAFNMAFIHAYEGNLSAARRFYKISYRRELSSITQFEIEEFLEWVLKKHPEKNELHYSAGMFHLFSNDHPELAREHFQKFLEGVNNGDHKAVVGDVQRYLDPKFELPKLRVRAK